MEDKEIIEKFAENIANADGDNRLKDACEKTKEVCKTAEETAVCDEIYTKIANTVDNNEEKIDANELFSSLEDFFCDRNNEPAKDVFSKLLNSVYYNDGYPEFDMLIVPRFADGIRSEGEVLSNDYIFKSALIYESPESTGENKRFFATITGVNENSEGIAYHKWGCFDYDAVKEEIKNYTEFAKSEEFANGWDRNSLAERFSKNAENEQLRVVINNKMYIVPFKDIEDLTFLDRLSEYTQITKEEFPKWIKECKCSVKKEMLDMDITKEMLDTFALNVINCVGENRFEEAYKKTKETCKTAEENAICDEIYNKFTNLTVDEENGLNPNLNELFTSVENLVNYLGFDLNYEQIAVKDLFNSVIEHSGTYSAFCITLVPPQVEAEGKYSEDGRWSYYGDSCCKGEFWYDSPETTNSDICCFSTVGFNGGWSEEGTNVFAYENIKQVFAEYIKDICENENSEYYADYYRVEVSLSDNYGYIVPHEDLIDLSFLDNLAKYPQITKEEMPKWIEECKNFTEKQEQQKTRKPKETGKDRD